MKKTTLALALLAGMAAAPAFAATTTLNPLGAGAADAFRIGTEQKPPITLLNQWQVTAPINTTAPTAGNTIYARITCGPNYTFSPTLNNTGDVTIGGNNATIVSGAGTSTVIASYTAGAPIAAGAQNVVFQMGGGNLNVINNVDCTVSLYDNLAGAQAGTTNTILGTVTDRVITPVQALTFTADQGVDVVADVGAANGPFSQLVAGSSGRLGRTMFTMAPNILNADATVLQIDQMIVGGGGGSYIQLTGNGSNRAFTLNTSATCSAGSIDGNWSYSTTTQRFSLLNPAAIIDNVDGSVLNADANGDTNTRYLCMTTAGGTGAIAPSSIQLTFVPVSTNSFVVQPQGPFAVGNIVQNATRYVAVLAQLPAGWMSRIAVTNMGGVDRNATVTLLMDSVNPASATATKTFVVKANALTVQDLSTFLSAAAGAPRASVLLDVENASGQVEAMYQIVKGDGAIDNSQMVRPGNP